MFPPTDVKLIIERYQYYDPDGEKELGEIYKYDYDEVGNLVQIIRYEENTEDVKERIEYSYDEAGNLVTEIYYNISSYNHISSFYDVSLLRHRYTYVMSKNWEVNLNRELGIEIENWQIEYFYDKDNLTREITYAYDGEKNICLVIQNIIMIIQEILLKKLSMKM